MATPKKEIQALLKQERLSKSDVVNLLSQTRILIESRSLQNKFRLLNLYCNWTLHPKLSGSVIIYKIMDQLTDILLQHHAEKNNIIHEVSNIISISGLRTDFISLYKKTKIPTNIFNRRSSWKELFGMICGILEERPLRFPEGKILAKNNKAKQIYDKIHQKAGKEGLAVKEFCFIIEKRKIYWQIITNTDNVYIRSPVIFLE